MTRFTVQSARDVEYSFEPLQPYYLLTGVTGSVSQALSGSWRISASAGKQRLNYHQTATVAIDQPHRVETVNVYGSGVVYRLSPDIHLGVKADYSARQAQELRRRNYEGLRVGGFVTYGLRGE
jgi:hypothetical protein